MSTLSRGRLVVVGGGFFGCNLAVYAKTRLGFAEAIVLEEAGAIMTRASYHNQARVHTGYHYPRAFTTAFRSQASRRRFSEEFAPAVESGFTKLYAIASIGSKVTAGQFRRFCEGIGAPVAPARREHAKLFDPRLIEAVFEVDETAFDAVKLAELTMARMAAAGVELRLSTLARVLEPGSGGRPRVEARTADGAEVIEADLALNCTYGRITGVGAPVSAPVRYELTEIALVEPPPELAGLGVTLMDGPFFSLMPFPAQGLHSLSHVRYTPHFAWTSTEDGADPYAVMAGYDRASSAEAMIRDACRYLPSARGCVPRDTNWAVKAVLVARESDDGRPILFERAAGQPRLISVLGGKIDNIYDAEAALAAAVADL